MVAMMARLGFGARGAVYLLVGSLALMAAIGLRLHPTGSRGALESLVDQRFGQAMLLAIAAGLACFAAWRFTDALVDADRLGSDLKGRALRVGRVLSGAVYLGLALFTLGLALGWGGGGGEDQAARDWTAWLMAKPFGRWLVGLVGVAVIGAGAGFAHKGWRATFRRHLHLDGGTERWAVPMGRAGFIARGLVFGLIGLFLVLAALHGSSEEARGLGGALRSLERQPFGWVLLGATGLGLASFGAFGLAQAVYRRIDAPDLAEVVAAAQRLPTGQ